LTSWANASDVVKEIQIRHALLYCQLKLIKEKKMSKKIVVFVFAVLLALVIISAVNAQDIVSARDTLVVAMPSDPANFDPNSDSIQMVHAMKKQIYETLIWRDYEGTLQPQLAESWEYPDDKTILLHIRKGVQFHGGYGELKASDVLFSLKRCQETAAASAVSQIDFDASKVVDDYTVKIVTKDVYIPQIAYFEWALTGIFSQKSYEDSNGDFTKNPYGTGAYELVDYTSGDSYVFKAFKDYWDKGKPYVENLIMRVVSESTNRTIELETGGVQLIYEAPSADIARLESNPDVKVYRDASMNTNYVFFNTSRPIISDPQVRIAIAHALDVETAVKTAYKGTGVVAQFFASPGVEGVDHDIHPYEYDVDLAKKMLADLGYADGFELTFYTDTTQERVDIVEIFQNQLKEVGITCNVQVIEPVAYQQAFKEGNFDMMVYGLTTTTAEGDKAFRWFHSGNALGHTFVYWTNPDYDKLIDEAAKTLDYDARMELYSRAQQILKDQCVVVPTLHREILTAASSELKGFQNNITYESPYLKGVYF